MSYAMNGNFVECCDCFTVCPCWVNDVPDEDHCSGLYLWSFGEGSQIEGVSVAGMHVAAASYHAVRAGGQAMFFIDAGIAGPTTERLLFETFAGRRGGQDFEALARLLGVYLGYRPASIRSEFGEGAFSVAIDIDGQTIAAADGIRKKFTGQAAPMTLTNAALNDELGVEGGVVEVQQMGALTIDVPALPGGPLNYRGRWGARSRFTYAHQEPLLNDEPVQAELETQDSDVEA